MSIIMGMNTSQIMYTAVASSVEFTGSVFISLLFIFFAYMLVLAVMRVPVEFSAILVLPTLIAFAAVTSAFMSILGATLIFVGVLFAKNFFVQ